MVSKSSLLFDFYRVKRNRYGCDRCAKRQSQLTVSGGPILQPDAQPVFSGKICPWRLMGDAANEESGYNAPALFARNCAGFESKTVKGV